MGTGGMPFMGTAEQDAGELMLEERPEGDEGISCVST